MKPPSYSPQNKTPTWPLLVASLLTLAVDRRPRMMFHIVLLTGITVIAFDSQAGLWSYLGAASATWTLMMLATPTEAN